MGLIWYVKRYTRRRDTHENTSLEMVKGLQKWYLLCGLLHPHQHGPRLVSLARHFPPPSSSLSYFSAESGEDTCTHLQHSSVLHVTIQSRLVHCHTSHCSRARRALQTSSSLISFTDLTLEFDPFNSTRTRDMTHFL